MTKSKNFKSAASGHLRVSDARSDRVFRCFGRNADTIGSKVFRETMKKAEKQKKRHGRPLPAVADADDDARTRRDVVSRV